MITGEPWERVGIDLTGPHPVCTKGNRYIVTLVDHFTKWVEVWPVKNQEAATVAQVLVNRDFCTHGAPLQILTDQGTNFESDHFKEICRRWSIDKVRTSAYKPSTNGNIDRFHATLNSTIAKWISADHRDWNTHLPAVAYAYRTSVHESTGFTPYFLMFGREAQIPADFVYGTPPDDRNKETTANDFVNQQNKMQEAFHLVRDSLGQAAERRKHAYDLRTRPCRFTRDMLVWYFIPRRRVQLSHKWQSFMMARISSFAPLQK